MRFLVETWGQVAYEAILGITVIVSLFKVLEMITG